MKPVPCITVLIYFALKTTCTENNVCPTYQDYYTVKNNPKCWYDFAADSNATEVIRRLGYPLEIYKVITPDGYILSVFRIPNYGNNKGPVYLQHGLHCSAGNYMGRGKNSLAFVLADAGYDVWLGNCRGSEYSEDHLNLTVFDKNYWDYSMDEIGLFDIPLQLNLVAEETGQKGNIVYIGHSLGTTFGLIYSSSFPEQARNTLKLFVFLSSAATVPNIMSPAKLLAPFAEQILRIVEAGNLMRRISQAKALRTIFQPLCRMSPNYMRYCIDIINLFYGPKAQMGPETIPIYNNQLPAGTSVKVLRHLADLALNKFTRYDYGLKNFEKYGAPKPPVYNISKVEVPAYLMYAVNDWVVGKKDSLNLYNCLSPAVRMGIYEVPASDFNHIDFLYGKYVKTLVYNKILLVLEQTNRSLPRKI